MIIIQIHSDMIKMGTNKQYYQRLKIIFRSPPKLQDSYFLLKYSHSNSFYLPFGFELNSSDFQDFSLQPGLETFSFYLKRKEEKPKKKKFLLKS